MKTHSVKDIDYSTYQKMDSSMHPDAYVYSFGSICGTVPYGRVITALIAFLEDENFDQGIDPHKTVLKVMEKMEEWNTMRSNALFATRGSIGYMDKRLFDIEEIADISHCTLPTEAIKVLKTFSSRTRMEFKFE
jgi:hypothetical protein